MLKEDDLVGVHCRLSPGGSSFHRQADRACQELRRPSGHRHRERAAAQRTAQRTRPTEAWSSRRRRRRCCRLSQALPAILSRCLRPCWRTPSASARPNSVTLYLCEGDGFRAIGDAQRATRLSGGARRGRPSASETLAFGCGQHKAGVPDRRCDVGTRLHRARSICRCCRRAWRCSHVSCCSDAERRRTRSASFTSSAKKFALHRQAD